MLAPCTVKAAIQLVGQWHRHLPDIQGGLFAVKVLADDGSCVGVGIAGNPSRAWQGQAKLVISRVATIGYDNACSMIYGALCRAAKALGYSEVWTYTLPGEPGTSLRAAGFRRHGHDGRRGILAPVSRSRARQASGTETPLAAEARVTASILPFEASSHRQLFVAVEEALLGAREAVFGARPQEVVLKPTVVNVETGEWALLPFERFIDAKGAMSDRRVEAGT